MSDKTDMTDTQVEARLRAMLDESAQSVSPADAPYSTIVRQGRAARRRARIAGGAGAVALAAVPGAAIAGYGPSFGDEEPEGQPPSASAPSPRSTMPADGEPVEGPWGPAFPERQLLDGITLEQASASLERCLAEFSPGASSALSGARGLEHSEVAAFPAPSGVPELAGLEAAEVAELEAAELAEFPPGAAPVPAGAAQQADVEVEPEELRILLAWVSQGDENRGTEPIRQVLAVSDDPEADPHTQFVCADRPGSGAVGLQSSIGEQSIDTGYPVMADPNADRYFSPMLGEWDLPFRWADLGLVSPEVERVTVSYAGETEEAVLEAGYFVVAGIAERQPDARPVIVGYGAGGEVVYDSREDPTYPES